MKTITALMAIAALGLAACGSSSDTSSSSSSSTNSTAASSGGGYGSGSSKTTKTTSNTSNTANASGGKVSVQMHDNFFGPKTITGKPGSTVTVALKNVGTTEHNFKIDGQKAADADVEPGKSGTATVKIPTSGTVQFYCEYHKGLGMVGTVKAS
jgi:plastocyanin